MQTINSFCLIILVSCPGVLDFTHPLDQEKLDRRSSAEPWSKPRGHHCWGTAQTPSNQFAQQAPDTVTGRISSGSTHVAFTVPEHIPHLGMAPRAACLPSTAPHWSCFPTTLPAAASAVGWGTLPFPTNTCSGAQLPPAPSSPGSEPQGFTGVSVGNKAQGIWALSRRCDEHISHQVPLWRVLFTGPIASTWNIASWAAAESQLSTIYIVNSLKGVLYPLRK